MALEIGMNLVCSVLEQVVMCVCQKCRTVNTCAKRSKSKKIPDFFPVDRLCIGAHKQILTDTHDHLFQNRTDQIHPHLKCVCQYLLDRKAHV